MKNPKWNRKLLLSKKDFKIVRQTYKCAFMKLDPQCKAMIRAVEAGKPITLDDQRLLARTLLGDIAKQTHIATIGLNKFCKGLAVECADNIKAANKKGSK